MRIRVDWLFLLVELAGCLTVVGMLLLAPTHHCVSFEARHGLRMMDNCPDSNYTGILEAPLEDVFIERTTNEGKQERGFLTSKMSVPRATVCNQIPLADINIYPSGKFLMGWVVYLLVQNVGFCCLRLTGEQMFRRRIGNAAVSFVTVTCLSLAIYMSLLDHDRLHSTAWSSFRSVVGGSSVGSSFVSTLPWNWNWAKIISICLFLWKIVHFIISHMHNDLTVGTPLPVVKMFESDAVETRRLHAGACDKVPLYDIYDLPPGVAAEDPITIDRKRMTDIVRMSDAAKKTQVGEKLREIAVASDRENTQDDCLLETIYGITDNLSYLKGPRPIFQLRELDGLYIIKCSSEYITEYTVDWLLQMAIGALNDGSFCVFSEDLAQFDGDSTRDELTKQFRAHRSTIDGKVYGFDVQDPELVMYPSEFFWVLVKKEITAIQ